MKIISWNCNCNFRKKYALLPQADILIIPESESPDFLQQRGFNLPLRTHLWVGKTVHKGLSIFTRGDYTAQIADFYNDEFQYIVPVEISTADKKFILWAVWTQSDGNDSYNGYVVKAVKALMSYEKYLQPDSLIIGDFNSNARWNKHFKREYNHQKLEEFMERNGFCSLYHQLTNCIHGAEQEATIYMYKNRERPYYIDYAFVHNSRLASFPTFSIGKYEDWIKHSDHMPLFMELN